MHNQDTFVGPSFSLGNRLRRAVWNLCYALLFRPSPRPLHAWRSWLLKCFGATVGQGVHVYPSVRIWAPWNITLHDECGVGDGVIMYSQGHITLGKRAVVSQGTHICTGTHDYTKAGHPLVTKPIYIGAQAWVTTEVFIHPGVQIGDGAVIGARSVVTRDMPAWTVCAGFPCKPLKPRLYEGNYAAGTQSLTEPSAYLPQT